MRTYRGLTVTAAHEVLAKSKKGAASGRIGALVDGLVWGVEKSFKVGADKQLKNEIDKIFPQIQKGLTNNNIVLVAVQYEQWASQEPGQGFQFLLSVCIVAAARDRTLAHRIYKNNEKYGLLKQGPRHGKVLGKKTLLYFEKNLTKEEQRQLSNLQKGRNLRLESVR